MVKEAYNFQGKEKKNMAKAFSSNVGVSTKYSEEICREIKGKTVSWAQKFLQDVADKKRHLPLKHYLHDFGHRKGRAVSGTKSGRYPFKTSKAWLKMLESVKSNADYKGLDAEKLIVVHAFASQGFGRFSHQPQGRISGKRRRKKAAHLEIIVQELS